MLREILQTTQVGAGKSQSQTAQIHSLSHAVCFGEAQKTTNVTNTNVTHPSQPHMRNSAQKISTSDY